jgi:hypothetical protein
VVLFKLLSICPICFIRHLSHLFLGG